MAKRHESERSKLPAHKSDAGADERKPAFTDTTEFYFNLMLLDSDLTAEELALVDRAAKIWCAKNNCECEAEATEHGFVIRLSHYEPDASVFQNRLSDALRRDAFSQIGKGFVPA